MAMIVPNETDQHNTERKKIMKKDELKLLKMSDIQVREVDWLWYPYIPFGKLTIIHGDPGEGKTTFALRLAAACSTGTPAASAAAIACARMLSCASCATYIRAALPCAIARITCLNPAAIFPSGKPAGTARTSRFCLCCQGNETHAKSAAAAYY